MNILFISHEADLNGASKSMINIIDELKDKHTFYVILRYTCGEVYDALVSRNIKVYSIKYISWIQEKTIGKTLKSNWYLKFFAYFCFSKFYNKIAAKLFYKKIFNKLHIDLIHSNTSVIDLGGTLKELSGVPHVWHIREMGVEDFNLYPYIGWKAAYRYIGDNADKIICVSDTVLNKITKYSNLNKCIRIYNGVGQENINPKHKCHDFSKKIIFLISGGIQKAKRQDIAIKAIQELHNRGFKQAQLLIAGRGSIKDIGLEKETLGDYIKLLGQVSNLNEIRKNVDVELVCSKCEAFGRVTIEAMLSGIPVVGSNSGGTAELIQDNVTGILFECGDYVDLADKLEGLIKQPQRIEEMGRRARTCAMQNYLIEICVEQINQVYEEIGNIQQNI